MSRYAYATLRPKPFKRKIAYHTITQLLHSIFYIWVHLVMNMNEDAEYIKNFVNLGYQQIDNLLDLYQRSENKYGDNPLQDLSRATWNLGTSISSGYSVYIVSSRKTDFVYRIDCSNLTEVQKSLLFEAFNNAQQINRTENGLCYVTTVIKGKDCGWHDIYENDNVISVRHSISVTKDDELTCRQLARELLSDTASSVYFHGLCGISGTLGIGIREDALTVMRDKLFVILAKNYNINKNNPLYFIKGSLHPKNKYDFSSISMDVDKDKKLYVFRLNGIEKYHELSPEFCERLSPRLKEQRIDIQFEDSKCSVDFSIDDKLLKITVSFYTPQTNALP